MLEPESIRNASTTALDETWAERLLLLRYNQLKIDLLNETDTTKLELWLEMFGISLESLPVSLSTVEYQRLLQSVIMIYRLSGTPASIHLLGYVLGASDIEVIQDYELSYNARTNYNGTHNYDSGELLRPFIVKLKVSGIAQAEFADFTSKMKKLFEIFEPVWIYLQSVEFAGDVFPLQFPFLLAGSPGFPLKLPFILK